MKFITFFIICLLILSGSGCQKIKDQIAETVSVKKEPEVVRKIENVELAKAILWPKPYEFTISRDPFRPLMEGKTGAVVSSTKIEIDADLDLRLVGITGLGNSYLALIETPVKTSVFRKGDKIDGYTIDEIYIDRVVLKKGETEVILKIRREK